MYSQQDSLLSNEWKSNNSCFQVFMKTEAWQSIPFCQSPVQSVLTDYWKFTPMSWKCKEEPSCIVIKELAVRVLIMQIPVTTSAGLVAYQVCNNKHPVILKSRPQILSENYFHPSLKHLNLHTKVEQQYFESFLIDHGLCSKTRQSREGWVDDSVCPNAVAGSAFYA